MSDARTALLEPTPTTPPAAEDKPRSLKAKSDLSDLPFRLGTRIASFAVLAIMSLVGVFLLIQGGQAIGADGPKFLTTQAWDPNSGVFGIAAVLLGSVFIALTAIVVAVPLATGTALYISEYAPRQIRQTLVTLVDLMAAVPSVVYGLWGLKALQPNILDTSQFITTWFGWIPIFHVDGFEASDPLATQTNFTSSTFIIGLVVGMMVSPIICSIMREVFTQAPIGEREGALALGATKWGMIRSVVLPFGRGGMIGGTMLGLGRALGETIAVALIVSPVYFIQPHILQSGANSISALIALHYSEASPFEISALMAAGLALFILTLFVNFGASLIIARSRSGASSD
jgi:phosphate transport system permease protein